jgi:hypothetical protein
LIVTDEISYLLDWIGIDYDSSTPNTRDALPMCKTWFEKCRASHSKCNLSQTNPVRASLAKPRFLAVGNGELRLCLGEEMDWNSQYAALSHCWGSLKFITLKQSNLNSFRKHIPLDTLPKTFRDAVDICRYLELPYLWIDSLCIIQDSEEDWTIQSALMAQIYGECEVNIAATSASNGSIGCFFDRPNQWLVQISSTASDNKDWIYDMLPLPLVNPANNFLATRGWVIQERYLSKRTLHFTNTQVFWECDNGSVCETCPNGYPERNTGSVFRVFDLERRYIERSGWEELVERYSTAKLTKPTDRLIAIEGLARAIQAVSNETYVAGMWIEWIDKQLAWFSHDFVPDRSINVPSWSWASGTGKISGTLLGYGGSSDYHKNTHIALYNFTVEYESENTFRGVKNALLRLSCTYLFQASLQPSHDPNSSRYTIDFGDQKDCSDELHVNLDFVDTAQKDQVISVYLLVITETCGLLLQPTAQSDGQFRRIGSYLSLGHEYIEKMSPTNFVGKVWSDIFSGVVVNENGDEIYIIDLV